MENNYPERLKVNFEKADPDMPFQQKTVYLKLQVLMKLVAFFGIITALFAPFKLVLDTFFTTSLNISWYYLLVPAVPAIFFFIKTRNLYISYDQKFRNPDESGELNPEV